MAVPMAAPSPASSLPAGIEKQKLANAWTYWELRKKDARQGLADWTQLPIQLYSFDTVEDFWLFWKRTPHITDVFDHGAGETMKIERDDERDSGAGRSRKLTTVAEAYMLFRKGVQPLTEYEKSPGVRATKNRRRAELAVRPKDFESWWLAWEVVVLSLIGEGIDPEEYITGAYLTDKHTHGSVSLRLEIWFSTDDETICDYICEELRLRLQHEQPDLPFRFNRIVKKPRK